MDVCGVLGIGTGAVCVDVLSVPCADGSDGRDTRSGIARWTECAGSGSLVCAAPDGAAGLRASWVGTNNTGGFGGLDSTRRKLHALERIKTIAVSADESRLHAAALRIPGHEVGDKEQPASL